MLAAKKWKQKLRTFNHSKLASIHAKCRFILRCVGVLKALFYHHLLPKVDNKVRKPIEFHQVLQDYWFTFTCTLTWTRTVAPSFSFSLRGSSSLPLPLLPPTPPPPLGLFSAPPCVCVCVRANACARHWLAGWLAGGLVWEIPGHDQWREGLSRLHTALYCRERRT